MDNQDESEGEQRELVPSDLDEITHTEMRLLFEESARSVYFAKAMQWKMLAGVLLLFGGLIVIAEYTATQETFVKNIVIVSLLVGAASIYCEVIFSFGRTRSAKSSASSCRIFQTWRRKTSA